MNKIVAIIGPTAVGKTDLAISLCKKFNGEIVSVDSRQAYKGMNIGTGKAISSNGQEFSASLHQCNEAGGVEVKVHLYDFALPSERLNAYDYSIKAWEKIAEVWSVDKTPFLVGGTGFYMDVILGRRKLSGIGVDHKLRSELEVLSKEELIKKLGQSDPEKLKKIDMGNKYRLIRAIEIAQTPGRAAAHPEISTGDFEVLTIGLTGENNYLYDRADRRVDLMVEGGLVDEVKGLVKKYGWEAPGLNALGYREFKPYLEGSVQLNESVRKLKYDTHAYLRRQKTYFKKYFADATWFDVHETGFEEKVFPAVELFLA